MRSIRTALAVMLAFAVAGPVDAEDVPPGCYNVGSGDVDVTLLLDDTGSFATYGPQVQSLFASITSQVQSAKPDASFAFAVSRFEEYAGFAGEYPNGRPFILNEALTADEAALLDALDDTTPGYGGDGPETAIEALHQLATGAGFDGDGDGAVDGSGSAGEPGDGTAGSGYLTPGSSGDVPAYVGPGLGGVGWRPDARHLVILATDIQTVAPYPTSLVPTEITGQEGSVAVDSSALHSTFGRWGEVGGSVSPPGAATVQETIDELNQLDIRVVGLAPFGTPIADPTGPSNSASVLTSALALLTGAVDDAGLPLVFNISSGVSEALVDAIVAGTSIPILQREAHGEAYTIDGTIPLPAGGVTFNKVNQVIFPSGGSAATVGQTTPGGPPVTVHLGVAETESSGEEDELHAEASSRSRIAHVEIRDATDAVVLSAETVVGSADAFADEGAANASGNTLLAGLTIAGTPVDAPVPPNTVVPVGGGQIVLNEQVPFSGPGYAGITVTPIHIQVPGANGAVDLSIGTVSAAASCKALLPGDAPVAEPGEPVEIDGV